MKYIGVIISLLFLMVSCFSKKEEHKIVNENIFLLQYSKTVRQNMEYEKQKRAISEANLFDRVDFFNMIEENLKKNYIDIINERLMLEKKYKNKLEELINYLKLSEENNYELWETENGEIFILWKPSSENINISSSFNNRENILRLDIDFKGKEVFLISLEERLISYYNEQIRLIFEIQKMFYSNEQINEIDEKNILWNKIIYENLFLINHTCFECGKRFPEIFIVNNFHQTCYFKK